jgi:hypothetical protein
LNLSPETTCTSDDYSQGKFKLLYFITTFSDNEEDAVMAGGAVGGAIGGSL